MRKRLLIFALLVALLAPGLFAATPVIIDTDMGPDDVMAIALILSHPEISVEAITVVHGLAHVPAGAANARRLVATSGRKNILVLEGREKPLLPAAEFPADWRSAADQPVTSTAPPPANNSERADTWLPKRLKDAANPVRILALGPLTNLAAALATAKPGAVEEIVLMGGALKVPGNVDAAPTAEWNFYADPEAAARVFKSGVPIRVVPLDATNRVKLDPGFVTRFQQTSHGPFSEIVKRVLAGQKEEIGKGNYYAWDPLAAAALLNPRVAEWTPAHVDIRTKGAESGRSIIDSGPSNAKVALSASRDIFEGIFAGVR